MKRKQNRHLVSMKTQCRISVEVATSLGESGSLHMSEESEELTEHWTRFKGIDDRLECLGPAAWSIDICPETTLSGHHRAPC